jgi:hypothetical protein
MAAGVLKLSFVKILLMDFVRSQVALSVADIPVEREYY